MLLAMLHRIKAMPGIISVGEDFLYTRPILLLQPSYLLHPSIEFIKAFRGELQTLLMFPDLFEDILQLITGT
jgi:hypothetical protein